MTRLRLPAACLVLFSITTGTALATTLRQFQRFTKEQRSVFVSGAVSALAYYFAANGEQQRSNCVNDWYFGKPGEETPGPRQLAIEIALAERRDPDKYDIEGVILAALDRSCGSGASQR